MVADSLFVLVKRLTERERRFVVGYAGLGHRSAEEPLALLAAMWGMEKYNAARLRRKFSNLDSVRHRLRKLILRALRAERDSRTQDALFRAHIADYEILYEKGLYEEALRSLNKAHAIAKEQQSPMRMLEVLHWQNHRLLETERTDLVEVMRLQLEQTRRALDDYVQQVGVVSEYHRLFASYRVEEGKLDFPKVDYLGLALNETLPFLTRLYAFQLAGMGARMQKDHAEALRVHALLLEFWRGHAQITQEQPGTYMILLSNYALYLFPTGDLDGVSTVLAEIERLGGMARSEAATSGRGGSESSPIGFNHQAETFQNIANLKILLQLNSLKREGLEELLTTIEEGLLLYESKINAARQFTIWFNMMLICLIHAEYERCRA